MDASDLIPPAKPPSSDTQRSDAQGQDARVQDARTKRRKRRGKPGAQPGNINAARSGVTIRRLRVGELPSSMRFIRDEMRSYRRALEDACIERHGEVSILHAHAIDACVGFELHRSICQYLLRTKDDMTTKETLQCSEKMARARADRNRELDTLRLGEGIEPFWMLTPARTGTQDATQAPEVTSG